MPAAKYVAFFPPHRSSFPEVSKLKDLDDNEVEQHAPSTVPQDAAAAGTEGVKFRGYQCSSKADIDRDLSGRSRRSYFFSRRVFAIAWVLTSLALLVAMPVLPSAAHAQSSKGSTAKEKSEMIPKTCTDDKLLPSVFELSTTQPQRIPYPADSEGGAGVYGQLTNGQRIGRHLKPEVMTGLGALSGALLRHGALSPAMREMIIVRTGYRTASAYEVIQHRALAVRVGVPEAKLDALACIDPVGLDETERVVINFVDELLIRNRATDTALNGLRDHYSDSQVIEIITVTGLWWSLARIMEAAGVPLDKGTIGEKGVSVEK
ncbi:carboxymuconolactone decarboxylase family protein [Cupriavidus sp. UME77]|uniref:carboxymuconolactone decarboxylase family protein n=1 Tax=Cupriavidus sp. UME77 TaxID=1862321 RepID=UPI001604552C|nr:carboxymuconolactone decarboxylase family protein [Cupriavidus sp. UME77]